MKLKRILACAVVAGLLTFVAGSVRATKIDNELVITLNAQLFIKWTDGNGKIQKARITSKDLVNAIGEDFDENFSGDQIVFFDGNGHYHLMDKHNNLVLDLTVREIIFTHYDFLSQSSHEIKKGTFKFVDAGILDFEFYSDGEQDPGLLDDNTIEFVDDNAPFTYTETDGPFNSDFLQQVNITEKDGIGADGHDFDATEDFDDLPIFGTMTQTGSGKVLSRG